MHFQVVGTQLSPGFTAPVYYPLPIERRGEEFFAAIPGERTDPVLALQG